MSTVQLIQVTPLELANMISESLQLQLQGVFNRTFEKPQLTEKELLTRKETAELLNVSLVTLHEWSKSGVLKPYKVGNRTYYNRSEVMQSVYSSNTGKR